MPPSAPAEIVADACFLLNLAATGREAEILRSLDVTLLTHDDVLAEALYLVGEDDDGQRVKEPVDFKDLEEAGFLARRSLGPHGIRSFVKAAERLTDRDAKAVALASELAVPLVTDDRCIRNLVAESFPEVVLKSSLELLKEAATQLALSTHEVSEMLRRVRRKGNFAPPRGDPLAEWFGQATEPIP